MNCFEIYSNLNVVEFETLEEGTDGFYYEINSDCDIEAIDDIMMNEFHLNYKNFSEERCCKWVEEVKKRANWVEGMTLYGYSREKHYSYQFWWSENKNNIGHYTWILESDGYLSLCFYNGYTTNEYNDSKYNNYIRPDCLYNDQNK